MLKNIEQDDYNNYLKLEKTKYLKLKSISKYIFNLVNETLVETTENEKTEEWIKLRYNTVKNLWSGNKNGINLMRIDFAWDEEGNFKVLELNTASHSGWFVRNEIKNYPLHIKIDKSLMPDPSFHTNYLLEKLGMRIIVITIKSGYKDLYILEETIKKLGGDVKIIQLPNVNIQEIIDFKPTGIFWRSNSNIVDFYKLVIEISKLNLPQIPSFESIFISGDKCFLSNLKNKDIMNVIPKTYVLDKKDFLKNINFLDKYKAVLKQADLSRGENIIFGKKCNDDVWKKYIQNAMNSKNNWIIQELCYLKRDNKSNKYEDLVVFIADGDIKGIASRTSNDEIVNVNKNGYPQPVVLI